MSAETSIDDIKKVNDIQLWSADLLSYNVQNDLVRSKELGSYDFSEIEKDFIMLLDLVARVKQIDLLQMPTYSFLNIHAHLAEAFRVVAIIRQFTVSSSVVDTRLRQQLIQEFKDAAKRLFSSLMYAIQFDALQRGINPSQLKQKQEEAEQLIANTVKSINDKTAELQTILNSFNEKAEQLGIVKYSEIFNEQADKFYRNYVGWLVAAILFFTGIIVTGILLLKNPIDTTKIAELVKSDGKNTLSIPDSLWTYYIVQYTVAKVLLISTLFLGLTVSIKNSRANRHNSIINKHRHNALRSFEAFVNSPSADVNTKNHVLMEATRTIFGHQTTGFNNKNESDGDLTSRIIEVIKPSSGN